MTLDLKIQLKGITKPPVWRKIRVSDQLTFEQLHEIIQEAFGWEHYHLYEFTPHQKVGFPVRITMPDEEWDDDGVIDASECRLHEILTMPTQKLKYIYDFGDYWEHDITVETASEDIIAFAELTAGKGACPPEDCGGRPGYEFLKEALSQPAHPDYLEMAQWVGLKKGEVWDPEKFDLEEARDQVKGVE